MKGIFDPLEGTINSFAPEPSASKLLAKYPPVSTSPNTAAPAPSPNKIHVPLSSQSSILVNVSAPITKTFLYTPAFIKLYPVTSPYTNPVHAASRSNPEALMPSLS